MAIGQGGSHRVSSGGVAERFNGHSWTGLAASLGGSESSLESVSCLSSSFCIAVGHTRNGTLAERFNGRSWSRVGSVSPAGPGVDGLNSVSCVSRRDCWAAGYIHGALNTPAGSLVEHYDGHAFTTSSTPRARGYLTSVSCATSASCWAVGDHGADHYDGHAWKPVSLPGSLSAHLSTAVSCRFVSACWIVGTSGSGASPPSPVALHLVGGSWRAVKMPNGPFQATNHLDEVACATASECGAVGGSAQGSPGSRPTEAPLAEHWNGSAWTLARVSAPSGQLGSFSGVSCAASGACVAVGLLGSASQSAGFIGSAMFAIPKPTG
ncbi:MAG: hypothetical protein ACYCX7_10805 [Solirubrobacteraceae bacterium]